jgi:hypothetical protein
MLLNLWQYQEFFQAIIEPFIVRLFSIAFNQERCNNDDEA